MAFNIGKIPDFSRIMKVPNFKLPEYDIGGAPRKINLSHKEEEIVQKFKAWVDLIDYDLTKTLGIRSLQHRMCLHDRMLLDAIQV